MSTTMNTQDPKWQASDAKPDKGTLWKHPPEKDGWMLAHNMIRGEVNQFIDGLESVSAKFPNSTPDWAVDSIKQIWSHHSEAIKDHHRNEDEIVNPFMKTRINLPEKLEADHEILLTKMREIENQIERLTAGGSLDELIDLMKAYKSTMFPHLEEEEQIALPLLRAYFSPDEFKEPMGEIISTTGKSEFGSMIDSMGVDYFRSTFMTQEGIPFFVWYLKFSSDHAHFTNTVKCHFDALKEGVAVTPKKASFLC